MGSKQSTGKEETRRPQLSEQKRCQLNREDLTSHVRSSQLPVHGNQPNTSQTLQITREVKVKPTREMLERQKLFYQQKCEEMVRGQNTGQVPEQANQSPLTREVEIKRALEKLERQKEFYKQKCEEMTRLQNTGQSLEQANQPILIREVEMKRALEMLERQKNFYQQKCEEMTRLQNTGQPPEQANQLTASELTRENVVKRSLEMLERQKQFYLQKCGEMANNHHSGQRPEQANQPPLTGVRNRAFHRYSVLDLQRLNPNNDRDGKQVSPSNGACAFRVTTACRVCAQSTPDSETSESRDGEARSRVEAAPSTRAAALSCGVCGEALGLNVFQCVGGHSACDTCRSRRARCARCGQPVTDKRNFFAETQVPCKNQSSGCSVVIKRLLLESHMRECRFGNAPCPLTAMFGKCSWTGPTSQLRDHFKSHTDITEAFVDTPMELHIQSLSEGCQQVYWVQLGAYSFLLHVQVCTQRRTLRAAVQLLGGGARWSYELHVYNKGQARRKFTARAACAADVRDAADVTAAAVEMPLRHARTFLNHQRLHYKVFIRKDDEP